MKKSGTIIAVVIAAIVLVGGGYLLFGKSNKPKTNSSSTNASTTQNVLDTNKSPLIIKTATDSSHGQYLTDATGAPLYTYGGDTKGVSNCDGSCLYNWPVYAPANTSVKLPANVTIIKRSNGASQYAYKGLPLYFFTSDSNGKPTGDGVGNFHLAKP